MRKRLSYNQVINKYQTFEIPLPNRKATDVLNNPTISNLLSATPEEIKNIIFDKIMMDKATQTIILDKETQKDFIPQHYDLHPHLYYKIDATSKTIPRDNNAINKNDSISKTVNTYDNINQTSYII